MIAKKQWIAMLLAGGQGSRLGVLTKNIAKPALYFGGKYRIIDFTLSNCVNSGIDTVGVLTQYQPHELNEYIANGRAWDLDRMYGGVHILPPFKQIGGGDFYNGTANAVYQNLEFIEKYSPQYVAVLSGDHVYEMDYGKMLLEHKKNNADCTIAVIDVDIKDAVNFGIMNVDDNGRITDFEEKPQDPKSTLASMGVYIFTYDKLKMYLKKDAGNKNSQNDFGKNIIPDMLLCNENLYAYRFDGYWKDVGTINSFWQANMDLLDRKILCDKQNPVYCQMPTLPMQYVGEKASISNSILTDGCNVHGSVKKSVLFNNVEICEDASVNDSIIMPSCVVKKGAAVNRAIIGKNCIIEENAVVGSNDENADITVIESNTCILNDRKSHLSKE